MKKMFYSYLNKLISFLKNNKKALYYSPKLIEKPFGKNILVLSPHMDDEIIGCGGTIIKHIESGDLLTIVFLTDATNSLPPQINQKKITEIRREESKNALKIIQVKNVYYLNEPDGGRGIKKETIQNIIKIIEKINPDLIYLPWYFDNHVDHRKFNEILYRVWKITKIDVNICAYEVWTPLIPNIIVDITNQHQKKIKALRCYKTQVKLNNYINKINGLNLYRSMTHFQNSRYIEAFYYSPIKKYFRLFKDLKN